MSNPNFESIRPFHDNEVSAVLQKLAEDKTFIEVLKKIFPEEQVVSMIDNFKFVRTVFDFQSMYISGFVQGIIKKTVSDFTFSGLEKLNPRKKYLFISNHRDIILDSAFLNIILHQAQFPTTQIAIGSNLLIYDWIKQLVRLNKSFIVKRGLGRREMLDASIELSSYIRKTITGSESSIWIAQKEGRTKDGNDKTHVGLLKMLNYSGKKDFTENFKELNIVPLSISYENEPCDILKTRETGLKKTGESYEKTAQDDLKSMAGGVNAFKGRVHFEFCEPVYEELFDIGTLKTPGEQFEALANLIDSRLYESYKLFENNYIAADILLNEKRFASKYTKKSFDEFQQNIVKKIDSAGVAGEVYEKVLLGIYANPVFNQNKIELPNF